MKRFSKVLVFAVLGVLCVSLLFSGCGDKNEEDLPEPEPIQTTESTPMPEATPTPPPTASPSPRPTPVPTDDDADEDSDGAGSSMLKIEDDSNEVKKLQEKLKDLGYLDANATGYFGTDTETAVKKFQKKHDLTEDGIVGPGTKKLLFSDDAKKAD